MTTLNDKEKAAENKYARDKEVQFKVHARRNKLLGYWAAEKMGMEEAHATEYAKMLTIIDLEKANDDLVIGQVKKDFSDKGLNISDDDIKTEMHRLHQVVAQQLLG